MVTFNTCLPFWATIAPIMTDLCWGQSYMSTIVEASANSQGCTDLRPVVRNLSRTLDSTRYEEHLRIADVLRDSFSRFRGVRLDPISSSSREMLNDLARATKAPLCLSTHIYAVGERPLHLNASNWSNSASHSRQKAVSAYQRTVSHRKRICSQKCFVHVT